MNARFVLLTCLVALLCCASGMVKAQTSWTYFGNLATARCSFCALNIGSGKIMVMGGSSGVPNFSDMLSVPLNSCEIVDIWQRRVYPTTSMNTPRSEFVALLTHDSNIVVLGGVTGKDPNGALTPVVELFDRTTQQWRTIGALNVARRQHVAVFIDDHRILVTGGRLQNYQSLSESEIFDMSTGKSTKASAFPTAINSGRCVTSELDAPLVLGGRTGGANSGRTSAVYAYNAADDKWWKHSTLDSAILWPAVAKLWDGRPIVAGGSFQESPMMLSRSSQVLGESTWEPLATLKSPRADGCIAQYEWDRVLYVGGIDATDKAIASCEWIDVYEFNSSPGPALQTPRRRFVALSAPPSLQAPLGSVAIVAISGQRDLNSLTPSIELLEPPAPLGVVAFGDRGASATTRIISASYERVVVEYSTSKPTDVAVRIASIDGRYLTPPDVVFEQEKGMHRREVNVNSLVPGTYVLEVRSSDGAQGLGFVLIR